MAWWMRRREFIITVLGGLGSVRCGRAQPSQRIPLIGVLWHAGNAQEEAIYLAALEAGLRDLGYVDGRSIHLEHRFPNEEPRRFESMAAELVALKIDILVAASRPAAMAAHRATTTIPTVFVVVPDPVGTQLVKSLAHPGGNITGLTNIAVELSAKRLALLKEVLPQIGRVALMVNANDEQGTRRYTEETMAGATALGLQVQPIGLRTVQDMEKGFDRAIHGRCDAVVTVADGLFYQGREIASQCALKRRLPLMMITREMLDAGALMTYGPDHQEIFRRAATYVHKILKGEKPADLPVEQPTRFQFLINLRTARTLGLEIAPTMLARADGVVE
jgi:putative ABC transport system substrate-binding protein